jgi:hypothetical protein
MDNQLGNLTFSGSKKLVMNWNHISVKSDLVRIYYLANKVKGFDFAAVSLSSGDSFEVLVFGNVYHDGLRHVFFGSDQDHLDNKGPGYQFCPNPKSVIEIFEKLSELELQF